jgi:hypothetical protein
MSAPYIRIIRPLYQGYYGHDHLIDPRYCTERQSLIHSFYIIQNDLKKIFDYIELHDNNKNTFSHRIYELFLRSCTEFENNCTGILKDNGYTKPDNFNIKDYFKINAASKLNEYEVKINVWSPSPITVKPFQDWNAATFTSLSWYQSYNDVKHNRSLNFSKASLENLIKSISGLYVILVSQFGRIVFNPYQTTMMSMTDNDGFHSAQDSILSVKFPTSWTPADTTAIDWNTIKLTANPFNQFTF